MELIQQQQAYMKKEFHKSDNKEFTYEDLKARLFSIAIR